MPNLRQNSTEYVHSYEPNTNDLVHAMEYNSLGQPVIRTVTGFQDSGNFSAFSRLRIASTRLLGEFRNMYGTMGPVEIITYFASGGSQTVDLDQTVTYIKTTTESGSRAIRQSRAYHSYIPGTTNLAFISFAFSQPKPNLAQMVGLFDDDNGIFLRFTVNGAEMVIRRAGTDAQVIPQTEWNIDRLDGTDTSKLQIDLTQAQIFVCDYQWLGVGRVRVGFNIDGRIYYCHYFTHFNQLSVPYTFQPSLPVRWEIVNTDTTESGSQMTCICYGVYTEGSEADTGFDNSVSTGETAITLGSGADSIRGLLAVRLKNTVNGKPVRAKARIKDWEVVTSLTARYRVMILSGISDLAGTPIWNSATPTGWCEYTTNFSLAVTPTPANAVVLFDGFATGSSNRGESTAIGTDNRSSAIHQNFDSTDSQIIAIVAYRIPNDNAVMRASMNWIEIK
jgi:hypothetical protein